MKSIAMQYEITSRGKFLRHDEVKASSLGAYFDLATVEPDHVFDFKSDSSSAAKIYEVDDLFQKYQYAKLLCEGVESARLRAAFIEAANFLNSGIFSDYFRPSIGVDEYGEFSFSMRSSRGYLDVGVCGTGEISYHIRNDAEPEKTKFGDVAWDSISPPVELTESAIDLLHE
jgi:hypothetical protein